MSERPDTKLHMYNIYWGTCYSAEHGFSILLILLNFKVFLRRDGLRAEQNQHYHSCGKKKKKSPSVKIAKKERTNFKNNSN